MVDVHFHFSELIQDAQNVGTNEKQCIDWCHERHFYFIYIVWLTCSYETLHFEDMKMIVHEM